MGYIIETPYMPNPLVCIQKQKAARLLRWAGYDAIAANGMLDTKGGHRIYNSYENTARAIERGEYSKGDITTIPLCAGAGNLIIKRV